MTEPVAPSAKIYGRLKESAHFAGYSFERACGHLKWLLEDDRWKLGGPYAAKIAAALGGAKKSGAGWLARCCCHEDRRPSLSLRDGDDGTLLVHCFAECDPIDILRELRRRRLLDDRPRDHQPPSSRAATDNIDATTRTARAREWWNEAKPIPGTLAQVYLEARGLRLPDDCSMLRFHPQCWRRRERHPALLCAMTSAITNKFQAVHRIFLQPDGRDRLRDEVGGKLTYGPAAGAVVRLSADEDVTTGLGITEGVEDGIAALNDGWAPIWATTGTSGMASLPVLGGIEALTVFRDAGAPGLKAAQAVVACWSNAGSEAEIMPLPSHAKDLNDLVRQRGRHER